MSPALLLIDYEEMMPRICRTMTIVQIGGVDRPKIGDTARSLGVRVAPAESPDIPVATDGKVVPGSGGMSVAPTWRDLPRHRIPIRLKTLLPSACGSNQDACWAMGEGAFEVSRVASGLSLRLDSPVHGLVEPEYNQYISEYRGHLAATRDQWVVAED